MTGRWDIFILYVGRMFALRFFALILFFVIVLQMLDLLNQSEHILAVEGATRESLVRYVRLKAPQIASQFTPFAALLGIVLTLAGLSHTSEITVMRAAGMSVHRVLFPLGFVCAVAAAAHFAFHETVAVRAAEALDYWETNEFATDLPENVATRTNIRVNFDGEFMNAESAARFGDAVILSNVKIYGFDENGNTSGAVLARRAQHENGVWRLWGVTTLNAETLETNENEYVIWTSALNPELLFALTLKPDQTPLGELLRKIRQLRQDNADTREAMTAFLSRFSKPMATLVMPLLGAIAGFGVHRQGDLLTRSIAGAAIGFGYFVVENLSLAVGKLGVIPAIIGAFFPLAIFMVLGFAILLAMEN
jgi:lipopolysaccharide export system permease protein